MKITDKHERETAKKFGGKRQPGSGSKPGYKGDIKTDEFLYEHKETKNKSFQLTTKDLMKIRREANEEGRDPAMVIRFNSMKFDKKWVVVPEDTWEEMKKGE